MHLRKLIAREVQSGDYHHLRSPNTRSSTGMEHLGWETLKARVNILCRSPFLPHDNRRNLSVGRLETLLVVQAPFANEEHYESGMAFDTPDNEIRIVVGDYLNRGRYFRGMVDNAFRDRRQLILGYLESGEYRPFVREILDMSDSTLARVKEIFMHPYPTSQML